MREGDSVLSRDYRCNILANCPRDKVEYNNSEVLILLLSLPVLPACSINFLKMINKSCGCGLEFYTEL